MNTKRYGITIVTTLLMASGLRAQDGMGLGVIVGEPTGISLKKWVSDRHAIDGAVGWSFSENDSVQIHADYLIHNFTALSQSPESRNFPIYVGFGGRIKFMENGGGSGRNDDDVLMGLRIPLGISYIFKTSPVDLFAELVPILDLVPDSDFDLNVAVGARFYFN